MTVTCLMAPLAIIQGIYAKYYGLSLTTLAAIILIARIFDAVSDPIIGYCSDRYAIRSGTRKPFMLAGGLLFIVSSYFLYVPTGLGFLFDTNLGDPDTTPSISVTYFSLWFIAIYLAWTLFEIPHITWAGELAETSNEKTKIYSFRSIAGYSGILLFYAVPMLPIFQTQDITPDTLRMCALIAGIIMLPLLLICLKFTPNGSQRYRISCDRLDQSGFSLVTRVRREFHALMTSLSGNSPFLLFVCAYLFSSIGIGMWYSLIFIYVDGYLGLGDQFAGMFLVSYIIGIIAIPIWYKAAKALGKNIVWMFSALLLLFSFMYTGMLIPSETGFSELVVIKTMQTLGFTCMGVVAPAMLSEITDYGALRFGDGKNATYFSCFTLIAKVSSAFAGAIGLGIAGWYGFDATSSAQTEDGIFGLNLAIAWLPPISMLIALVFIWLSPINERRYAIIRKRLNNRSERENSIKN